MSQSYVYAGDLILTRDTARGEDSTRYELARYLIGAQQARPLLENDVRVSVVSGTNGSRAGREEGVMAGLDWLEVNYPHSDVPRALASVSVLRDAVSDEKDAWPGLLVQVYMCDGWLLFRGQGNLTDQISHCGECRGCDSTRGNDRVPLQVALSAGKKTRDP